MMNTYHIRVRQPENYPIVEIQIFTHNPEEYPGSGCISSVAVWAYDENELKFYVRPNVQFSNRDGYSPEEAQDIADWWRLAAQGVNTLKDYILSKEDFDKTYTVRVIGKSFVIEVEQ